MSPVGVAGNTGHKTGQRGRWFFRPRQPQGSGEGRPAQGVTYPGGGRRVTGLVQQSPRSLKLVVFALQLDGRQPDLLAVGVGLESQRQDAASSRYVALEMDRQNMRRSKAMEGWCLRGVQSEDTQTARGCVPHRLLG